MNKQTLKITQGAMMVAIFGMLLLINRQTAGLFEGVMFFILPIPMVAYSAMYGLKPGLSVFVAMSLVSVLFGSIMTMFYSVSQCLVGLVFGSLMFKKVDLTKVLFAVMGLSALSSVGELVFKAALLGYNLNEDVKQISDIMLETIEKVGMEESQKAMLLQSLETVNMAQMFIVSAIFWGLITGFCIFEMSLIILKRLKFKVPKPKSVFCYYPPKILGILAFLLYLCYSRSMAQPFANSSLQVAAQTLGMCGYLYLTVFGVIGILLWCRKVLPRVKFAGVLFSFLGVLIAGPFLLILGLFYASGSLHESMMAGMEFD